jgi:hypothetical protein
MSAFNRSAPAGQPSETGFTKDAEDRLKELRRKKALKGETPSIIEQLEAIDPAHAAQLENDLYLRRKARRNEEMEKSVLREQKLKESMASVKLRKEIEEAKRRGNR